jgi:hypothetical protein
MRALSIMLIQSAASVMPVFLPRLRLFLPRLFYL